MKYFFKRALFLATLAALLFVFYKLICYGFDQIILKHDREYVAGAIGAFFGSLSAAALLIFQSIFESAHSRRKLHLNGLVKHGRLINESFTIIEDNIQMLSVLIESARQGHLGLSTPTEIPIDREILTNSVNIDYVNDAFTFNVESAKANSSLDAANELYKEIKYLFIESKITKPQFKEMLQHSLIPQLLDLRIFLEDLSGKAEVLYAKNTEITFHDESIFTQLVRWFYPKQFYPRNFDKSYRTRLSKIREDRNNCREESTREIKNREARLKPKPETRPATQ